MVIQCVQSFYQFLFWNKKFRQDCSTITSRHHINAPCVVCKMYEYIRSLSVGVSLKYSCLTSPFRKIMNSNLSIFHHVVLYQSCALGWNQKKKHGPNFSTSDCYFILVAIIFLSLIHLVRFFHEIFPRFEHSWINTSFFFIMAKKLWQY